MKDDGTTTITVWHDRLEACQEIRISRVADPEEWDYEPEVIEFDPESKAMWAMEGE